MNCLQKKKLAFMSVVNSVKGFVRNVFGVPPLTLPDCVDEDSLISYAISGSGVGDYDEQMCKYKIPIVCSGKNMLNPDRLKQGTIPDSTGVPQSSTTRVRTDLIPLEAGDYYMCISAYNNLSLRIRGVHVYSYDTEEWEGYTTWNSVTIKKFAISAKCKASFIFQTPSNDVITIDDVLNGNPMFTLQSLGTEYEPYTEPITTNIYLDEPLSDGQTLRRPVKLPTIKGTTVYTIDTSVQPTNMSAVYFSTSKE